MILRRNILILCLALLVVICDSKKIFSQVIRFNHLTVEDGLSSNRVNNVIQDRTGFLWFGTEDGLNRYDGYNFKVFRHIPSDTNSISDNSIWSILEDSKGNIWVGTKAGILNKYNPKTEKFKHWKIESELTQENSITSIYEDSSGFIWIGTYKEGLYKLDLSKNKLDHWVSEIDNERSLSHNYIRDIIEDSEGNLFIATYIGLNKFDPDEAKKVFQKFYASKHDENSLSNNLIWSLSNSALHPNIIWICTFNHLTKFNTRKLSFEQIKIDNPNNLQYGTSVNSVVEEIDGDDEIIWTASYSGLVKVNITTGESTRFIHSKNNLQSIGSNQINKIIKDNTGVIWAVTEKGISYLTPKSTLFNSVRIKDEKNDLFTELKNNNITALVQSNEGKTWIGTSDGLYFLNSSKKNPELVRITMLDGYHIWSISTMNEEEIWIGTYGKGLKQFKVNHNKIIDWDLDDPKIRTQSVYYNRSLLVDRNKKVWVGYWGIGAARIDPQTGAKDIWLNDPDNKNSLSHNDVWVIKEDRLGRIWIGTQGGGLNLFEDRDEGVFHHYFDSGNDKIKLSSNNINSICVSKQVSEQENYETVLWIGTSNGLNKFLIKNKNGISNPYDIKVSNQFYTVKDGLPDNSVNSIVEDDDGNLWLGTGSGISFFNVNEETFKNFTVADGIRGNLMNPESALRMNNGFILIGSAKGLNIFNPKKINLSTFKPNLVFTDFQIFNKSIKPGKSSNLYESIPYTNEIRLSHDQDVFSFEFATLDYNSPASIEYAYQMEGFDEGWINSGKRRFVTYTNLDPGVYTFKVKSTNADGIWNEEYASIKLKINPPWWQTIWAYLFYILLIALGLFVIRRFELNRASLRNELKMRQFEAEQKTQLEEIKSRFFANLSHEFRTPLMLIKGPLEKLKENRLDQNSMESLELIDRNSERLKQLIDQLLELSQLEKASIPLKAKKENLEKLLKGLVSSFESLAEQKNISLTFKANPVHVECWIDIDKFEKIINNLLSNAFKFTPEGGSVNVVVQEISLGEKQFAEIKISDSGVGIPEDKLDKIFDRFVQTDDSIQRTYGGSGIGLSLVKEFTELHKWEISVESKNLKGTEFTIRIPMWESYLSESEKIEDDLTTTFSISNDEETNKQTASLQRKEVERVTNENKPLILIVDDSEDVQKYLKDLLKSDYKISVASEGEEGIQTATENLPDLIISDVMMPVIDGYEFCHRIKSNWQTSDIPVILLTAKASAESKVEGLETGADDYLTKPFESKELFARIKNLLKQRIRLRKKYSREIDSTPRFRNLNKADEELINKVLKLIEENLDKTNFSTDRLAKELLMSRTQLHRKLISITGQAPGEFIRNFKLKKAASFILEGKLSVTQVAYEIGFSSPSQFTRAFSKQFNCTPSEYTSNKNYS